MTSVGVVPHPVDIQGLSEVLKKLGGTTVLDPNDPDCGGHYLGAPIGFTVETSKFVPSGSPVYLNDHGKLVLHPDDYAKLKSLEASPPPSMPETPKKQQPPSRPRGQRTVEL